MLSCPDLTPNSQSSPSGWNLGCFIVAISFSSSEWLLLSEEFCASTPKRLQRWHPSVAALLNDAMVWYGFLKKSIFKPAIFCVYSESHGSLKSREHSPQRTSKFRTFGSGIEAECVWWENRLDMLCSILCLRLVLYKNRKCFTFHRISANGHMSRLNFQL